MFHAASRDPLVVMDSKVSLDDASSGECGWKSPTSCAPHIDNLHPMKSLLLAIARSIRGSVTADIPYQPSDSRSWYFRTSTVLTVSREV